MHTGVDWATAYGTPIFAAGNGVIEKAQLEGGYGKYVRIKHNNGYETAYDHMSASPRAWSPARRCGRARSSASSARPGSRPARIVHYEMLVNGRFVDPMRVKLPRGRSLEGPMLAGFEKERDRLDGMMSGRNGAIARMSDATGGPLQVSNR